MTGWGGGWCELLATGHSLRTMGTNISVQVTEAHKSWRSQSPR
jgi:hypothetical protein